MSSKGGNMGWSQVREKFEPQGKGLRVYLREGNCFYFFFLILFYL